MQQPCVVVENRRPWRGAPVLSWIQRLSMVGGTRDAPRPDFTDFADPAGRNIASPNRLSILAPTNKNRAPRSRRAVIFRRVDLRLLGARRAGGWRWGSMCCRRSV